jgi:molecular chaperone IbpA
MAVAGFSKSDIDVELVKNTLEVSGQPGNPLEDDVDKVQWIHRGIAKRGFNHKFKIADNVEVKSAELTDGMLCILLEEFVPEEQKPKKISLN